MELTLSEEEVKRLQAVLMQVTHSAVCCIVCDMVSCIDDFQARVKA